jgi:hypothetical protein
MTIAKEAKNFGMPWEKEYGYCTYGGRIYSLDIKTV